MFETGIVPPPKKPGMNRAAGQKHLPERRHGRSIPLPGRTQGEELRNHCCPCSLKGKAIMALCRYRYAGRIFLLRHRRATCVAAKGSPCSTRVKGSMYPRTARLRPRRSRSVSTPHHNSSKEKLRRLHLQGAQQAQIQAQGVSIRLPEAGFRFSNIS